MKDPIFLSIALVFYCLGAAAYGSRLVADKNWLKRVSYVSLWSGIGFQTLAVTFRSIATGHAPVSNLYESIVFLSWAFMVVFALTEKRFQSTRLGAPSLFLNIGFISYAFITGTETRPLMPALHSYWMWFHVTSCLISYASFAVAFVASVVYLTPLHKKIMPQEQLDAVMNSAILLGFPFLSVGITLGAVWAYEAWGTYWSWDPKETWALITWFVYAIYLHYRLFRPNQKTVLAWIACIGFLSVVFTYLGVSFLLSGLHSYASPS